MVVYVPTDIGHVGLFQVSNLIEGLSVHCLI